MADWREGNKPDMQGFYWVTVKNGGASDFSVMDEPLRYEDGEWYADRGRFYADNIVAHLRCNKPTEPYSPQKIGYADDYYIRVTRKSGEVYIYSKQLQSVKWSRIGYYTKGKAVSAMKRLMKSEAEEGYNVEGCVYEVINGNSEVVAHG